MGAIIKKISHEAIRLPNGDVKYFNNASYGGNGFLVYERSKGKCEHCGAEKTLCITRMNGYSNELKDLKVLCRKCHSKIRNNESFRKKYFERK